MMRNFILAAAIAAATLALNTADARMAKSVDYELEYASVNAGSADSGSSNYSIVSVITTDGVAGGVSSSTSGDYTLEPVIGAPVNDTTTVQDWTLY